MCNKYFYKIKIVHLKLAYKCEDLKTKNYKIDITISLNFPFKVNIYIYKNDKLPVFCENIHFILIFYLILRFYSEKYREIILKYFPVIVMQKCAL